MRTTQDFVDGAVSDTDDKTTGYTYNGAGMTSLTAYLTGGGVQVTSYLYGVTQAGGSVVAGPEGDGFRVVLEFPQDGLRVLRVTDELRSLVEHQVLGEALQRLPL